MICPSICETVKAFRNLYERPSRLRKRNALNKKSPTEVRLLSGKRDSNSRPRPWQGRALPTELLPQLRRKKHIVSLNCAAKIHTPNWTVQVFS